MPAEAAVQGGELDGVTFGRNRLLKAAGGVLFGLVTDAILRSEDALATHEPTPYPCVGYRKCDHCCGRICCQYCRKPFTATCWANGAPNSDQCWNTCRNGVLYRCCDWVDTRGSDQGCICVERWGSC